MDKKKTLENLELLRERVAILTEQGFLDEDAALYNELLDLKDEVDLAKTQEEIAEAIERGKGIEETLDAWAALHGRSSLCLDWN